MAGEPHRIPPPVIWAQRNDKVYVTICLPDCSNPTIKLEEDKLYFFGKGGPEQKEYEMTMEFYKEVNPEESKYVVLPRHIPIMVRKKEDGPYWPHLMKQAKAHWLKTDFDKWRDEDDSDAEEGQDMQLEEMMRSMGNFNGGSPDMGEGPPPDEEEDSDDEELPDLE
ncbi:hypothetical protein NP493_249g04016 [Ridgeia piscesae]|uniref:CS domain-containing protein n=1 Tax=Ridgeia piscesae TaxID=27915 RepID=A0AAD9NYN4_RIDPI|nr:hypothetical protein NP493_249g04016 [Ridgeia piscesae]